MVYRVIQWGMGNSGSQLLNHLIDSPDVEVVGIYAHSPIKNGLDGGILCGRSPIGVYATNDKAEILALDADCVFHNARVDFDPSQNDSDIIALLSSGKNVITIVPGFFAPASRGKDKADAIEAACNKGNSTLFGTGLSPGICPWLGVLASGLSQRLEEISYTELYDPSPAPRANILDVMGMGKAAEEFHVESARGQSYFNMFSDIAYTYAAALSCEISSITRDVRIGLATRDLTIAAGPIAKGSVAAVCWTVIAETAEGVRIRCSSQRIVQPDLPGWDWAPGWSAHLDLKGTPAMKISFTAPPEQIANRTDLLATVMAQYHALPAVVTAPRGIMIPNILGAWSPRLKQPEPNF